MRVQRNRENISKQQKGESVCARARLPEESLNKYYLMFFSRRYYKLSKNSLKWKKIRLNPYQGNPETDLNQFCWMETMKFDLTKYTKNNSWFLSEKIENYSFLFYTNCGKMRC